MSTWGWSIPLARRLDCSSSPASSLSSVRLNQVELRRIRLPLVAPFRSSQATEIDRELLLVHVTGPDSEGWGECAAFATPHFSSETVDSAQISLRTSLIPLLDPANVDVKTITRALAPVDGSPMAKASLESAVWDAELRSQGQSLASRLGGTRARVPAGVAVGLMDSLPQLVAAVGGYVDQGYLRVKLKIQPSWDLDPVRAIRKSFPELPLQVDANMAYELSDLALLKGLDDFDLLLVEQPLGRDDLHGHAELAGSMATPICLDESITSTEAAAAAVELGACSVINIKPGRVGGLAEAVRLHDFCVENEIPAWCGGMLESGVGRAVNLALASLPGFTLVGDLSASSRYFQQDLTPPFELQDGYLPVPSGPGIGVEPIVEVLDEVTTSHEVIEL